jgi:hypothetical protein
MTKASKKRLVLESINTARVIQTVNDQLTAKLGQGNVTFDKSVNSWTCQVKERSVPVFVTQISSPGLYIEKSESSWLSVVLDWDRERPLINHYNALHFLPLESFLEGDGRIKEALFILSESYPPCAGPALSRKFDTFISSVTPGYFEKQFVDDFFSGLKAHSEDLTTYIGFLTKMKSTCMNSKIVFIGGPGQEDFVVFDLAEYIQAGLAPGRMGEAKRFSKARFTSSQFSTAEMHAHGADTLYVIATNDVQPQVWDEVWEAHLRHGYFQKVIFDKSLILLLILNAHLELLR